MPARTVQQLHLPSHRLLAAGIVLGLFLLLGCCVASVALGVANISPGEIYQALTNPNGSTEHLIIRTVLSR